MAAAQVSRDAVPELSPGALAAELDRELGAPGELQLARAALVVARLGNPTLDRERVLASLRDLAAPLAGQGLDTASPHAALAALSQRLFGELGFHGDPAGTNDPRNSYLDEVLARRAGLPITLAAVFIETGALLGVPLAGVSMPGHFLVRHTGMAQPLFLDAWNGGDLLRIEDCLECVRGIFGADARLDLATLAPAPLRDIVARMLRNLLRTYHDAGDEQRLTAARLMLAVALGSEGAEDEPAS